MEIFKNGDKLKVIDNLDNDGEVCEGGLQLEEIVTMKDRTSECRQFIIVERTNGRQVQLEKHRFELA